MAVKSYTEFAAMRALPSFLGMKLASAISARAESGYGDASFSIA